MQNFSEAAYFLGKLYLKGEQIPKDYPIAKKWFEVAANNNFVSAEYALGQMHYHGLGGEKNWKKALHWLKQANDHGEKKALHFLQLIETNSQANSSYKDGLKALNKKEMPAAEVLFRNAIKIRPDFMPAYAGLIGALSKQNKTQEVIKVIEASKKYDHSNAYLYGNIGYVYSTLNQWKKAVDYYHKALAIDPNHKTTIINLKNAERKIEQY